MALEFEIVNVTEDNLAQHPQIICFINPKHEFYGLKVDWLKEQYKNGLQTKLLYLAGEKKPVGFIETIPGEFCWRAVHAPNYLFIHCLWINGKKLQHQGLGAALLAEAEKEAAGKAGIAVVSSDNPFMATKEIFLQHGYEIIEESGKDQLLAKTLQNGELPRINNWQAELAKLNGLHIIYANQCPWAARFIKEIEPILQEANLQIEIAEIKSAQHMQQGPSLYGVFNFIRDGRLLADRYISTTRFKNILKAEKLI